MLTVNAWNHFWRKRWKFRISKFMNELGEMGISHQKNKTTIGAPFNQPIPNDNLKILQSDLPLIDRSAACDELFILSGKQPSTVPSPEFDEIYRDFQTRRFAKTEAFVIRECCDAFCKYFDGEISRDESFDTQTNINTFLCEYFISNPILWTGYSVPWDPDAYPEWVSPKVIGSELEVLPLSHFLAIPNPSHVVCFRISEMYCKQGDVKNEITWLNRAIDQEPVSVERYWYARGCSKLVEHNWDSARLDFEEWMRLSGIELKAS